MIVYVKLTPRRWIALDVGKEERRWTNAHVGEQTNTPDDARGLLSNSGELIAGPGPWDEVEGASD